MDFEALKAEYASTILGRLKLKLYEMISGSPKRFPGPREQRVFLLDVYKRSSVEGQIVFDILGLNAMTGIDFANLKRPANVRSLIQALEEDPLAEVTFVELNNCPAPAPANLGMLIHREELDPSGFFYVITLLDESVFPELMAGHIQVRCYQAQPEPVFGILESEGFLPLTFADWESSAVLRLVVCVLHHLEGKRRAFLSLEKISELARDSPFKPPEDTALINLIVASYRGIIPCYKGIIPIGLIRPHDFEFALDFPRQTVLTFVQRLRKDPLTAPPMLVYWKADRFVMSDDYPLYLAHREIGSSFAPVVILGEAPQGLGIDLEKGGSELIPPLLLLTEETVSDYRAEGHTGRTLAVLHAIYRVLSELIQLSHLKEKKLHEFLQNHPVAVGPAGSSLRSEVRLGKEYVVDLVLQIPDVQPRIVLIELERANLTIFTKKGRPRSEVVHAAQQVEDWIRWWRENPEQVPSGLDPAFQPEGLVVIGRSRNLGEEDKRRLAQLNANRKVQIITYDELLEQLGSLIRNLEQAEALVTPPIS